MANSTLPTRGLFRHEMIAHLQWHLDGSAALAIDKHMNKKAGRVGLALIGDKNRHLIAHAALAEARNANSTSTLSVAPTDFQKTAAVFCRQQDDWIPSAS